MEVSDGVWQKACISRNSLGNHHRRRTTPGNFQRAKVSPRRRADGRTARTLTIYLVKENTRNHFDVLPSIGTLAQYRVPVGGFIGDLYVKTSNDRAPAWLSLFENSVHLDRNSIYNASSAAIFLVTVDNRLFAITFGYGRTLLHSGCWEEDFGLKATLNSVDPQKIRSVDRVKFDAISQHSQIQASTDAGIADFGLDVEQDLLRAVTGKPLDSTLGSRLTGKDALKADVRIVLDDLPTLLSAYLGRFQAQDYREYFSWVDHVQEVRDRVRVEQLDQILTERLALRNLDRIWLGIPDRIDWEGIAGFKYRDSSKADIFPDIHFTQFFELEQDDLAPTIEFLRERRHIFLVSHENDNIVSKWPLYRCIYAEIDHDGQTFLLNNGKWYRIRADFLDNVNQVFESLLTDEGLPRYSHDSEEHFNEHTAEQYPQRFAVMDRKLIRYPLPGDSVEFCDLYSVDRQIIHVKRYRGSATLSHLFAQGMISAELICSASGFRTAVNELLPILFKLVDPATVPERNLFAVVFAIVSQSRHALALPFFSKVNLKNAARYLIAFGFRVSVTKIQAA
jgi:uncharacterized protein (TIGR04141 family)